jgi:RHS repeat-associated protein
VVAQEVVAGSAAPSALYLLHDALGSVIAQVYANGGTWLSTGSLAYGPWGDSRDPGTGVSNLAAFSLPTSGAANLGFEGQTNLSLGLVHMGGRVYDPMIGRFLSADPNVQYPLSPQSYNRYAYVNNNPLSFTDPTGYLSLGQVGEIVAIVVISYYTGYGVWSAEGGYAGGTGATVMGGMAGGTTAGYLSTPGTPEERLKGAEIEGFEGAAFAYAGAGFGVPGSTAGTASYFEKAVVEGLIGGAFTQAGGGRFGDGFLGGAIGSLDEPLLKSIGSANTYRMVMQAVVAATIGGTLSDISGGKFADGAETAGFQNLFNSQEAQEKKTNLVQWSSKDDVVLTVDETKRVLVAFFPNQALPDQITDQDRAFAQSLLVAGIDGTAGISSLRDKIIGRMIGMVPVPAGPNVLNALKKVMQGTEYVKSEYGFEGSLDDVELNPIVIKQLSNEFVDIYNDRLQEDGYLESFIK